MMPFLISLFARWGVPERSQRLAAIGAAVVAFLALCGLLAGAWALIVHHHDKQVIQQHDAKREIAANGARETASDERVKDTARDTKNEEDLHHVIESAPSGGTLSPAAHALACERLRKLGRIPPACGPQGAH